MTAAAPPSGPLASPRADHVAIRVPDYQASARWYEVGEVADHLRREGYAHLCSHVEDLDAAMAELERRGVPALMPPSDYPQVGLRIGFVQDDTGNVIELAQTVPGAGTTVTRRS